MITLTRIAMIVPTTKGIYAPSRITPPQQLTEDEFIAKYADYPHVIPVSFEDDGRNDPQMVTAYGFGLDCWWIVSNEN